MKRFRIIKEHKPGSYTLFKIQRKWGIFWLDLSSDGAIMLFSANLHVRYYSDLEEAKTALNRIKYSGPQVKEEREVVYEEEE